MTWRVPLWCTMPRPANRFSAQRDARRVFPCPRGASVAVSAGCASLCELGSQRGVRCVWSLARGALALWRGAEARQAARGKPPLGRRLARGRHWSAVPPELRCARLFWQRSSYLISFTYIRKYSILDAVIFRYGHVIRSVFNIVFTYFYDYDDNGAPAFFELPG